MGRSIRSQLIWALDQTTERGRSRHSDRAQGLDTRDRTYSNTRAAALRDRAKNFADFMVHEHPEIHRVRDITSEHVQEYVNSRGGQWSAATQRECVSEMGVIERRVQIVYGGTEGWTDGVTTRASERDRVRDRAMDRGDYERLHETMEHSRSAARVGLELGHALGLRADEVTHVRGRDIDLEAMVVHMQGSYCKGGRAREISIDPADREIMQDLHDRYGDNRICPITAESFDRALRRGAQKCGISDQYPLTMEHAIRKEWARERYEKYGGDLSLADPRQDPTGASQKAWEKVQEELGHGSKMRPELYRTYCQAK